MTKWTTQVGGLLIRSRPFRELLGLVAAASLVVMVTSMWISAATMSPEQQSVAMVGSTTATVQPVELPRMEPGEELVPPQWLGGMPAEVLVIPIWDAWVPIITDNDQRETSHYWELSMPSPRLEGTVELADGDWPSKAGQCAMTGTSDRARSTIGQWDVTVVGHVKDIFHPASRDVYCAPGTWKMWRLSSIERDSNDAHASVNFAFMGASDVVASQISQLSDAGHFGPVDTFPVFFRDATSGPATLTANKFLGRLAPMLALPFVVALVAAARLARWSGVVVRALGRAGVAEKPMRRVVARMTLFGVVIGGLCGALLGALLAVVTRPLALWVNHGVPLSDWRFPTGDAVALTVACLIGAGIGLALGDAVARSNLGQQDRPARPLSKAALVGGLVAAVVIGAIGIGVLVASNGRNWWMLIGGVILVFACALSAPALVAMVGSGLSRRTVAPGTLAGRVITEDSRRWGLIAAVLSIVLGLVFTLFTISASSIAGQLVLEASQVPPGSARLEMSNPSGEEILASTVNRFESDLGLGSPSVTVKEINVALGDWGVAQSVESVDAAQQLLGTLSPDAVMTLTRGGVLVIGHFTQGRTSVTARTVPEANTEVDLPIMEVQPDRAHRWATGGGIVLADALTDGLRDASISRVWSVYQGLSSSQDDKARLWNLNTGMDKFHAQAYQPSLGFYFPLWLAISLCGFGLMLAPILALSLRHEVRAFTGLAAGLKRLGVAELWIRKVFGSLVVTVVAVSAMTSLLAALVATFVLKRLYPSVFDLSGVPWWALAGFIVGLALATELAVLSAVHSLTRKKHPITM